MAQSTIAEDITRLEGELASLREKIKAQEELDELEEGGSGSRFRTSYTDIDKLYKREIRLQTRLDTLCRSAS